MKQLANPRLALALLLGINLFNYIDRYVLAAVLPRIRQDFLAGDPHQFQKAGWLFPAFLISYMCAAPIFGWLADRMSRWRLIAFSVAIWSLASGWSGLATAFAILLCTRAFVGIGEAGYGPAAPTILSDLYSLDIPMENGCEIYLLACKLAQELNHHLFDTLYHAVALSLSDAQLVTADARYYYKARQHGSIYLLSELRTV